MATSVLEYEEKTNVWQWKTDIDLLTEKPKAGNPSYLFLHKGEFYKDWCSDQDRRKILAPYDVPDFLCSQMCTDLNGYFGCKSSLKDPSEEPVLDTLSTWIRILTKKILKHDEERTLDNKDYLWYEMAFFMRWSSTGINQILCIDTPPELGKRLTTSLTKSPSLEFRDPFAMLLPLLDEVLKLCDENTWRVAKEVRKHEKSRSKGASFEELCNLHRHARHLVEVEAVAIETMECLFDRQKANFEALPKLMTPTYRNQATEYLQFQLQVMKSLRWRSQASAERLDGEMNLAYNLLVNMDSQIMKSVTLLTMIFLPATFVSALFSTTFFSFEDGSWNFSHQFWIYWAVTVPLTLFVLVVWWIWLGGSYKSIRSRILSVPPAGRK